MEKLKNFQLQERLESEMSERQRALLEQNKKAAEKHLRKVQDMLARMYPVTVQVKKVS